MGLPRTRGEYERFYDLIAPEICHLAWCAYMEGAGKKYNPKMTKHSKASLDASAEDFKENPKRTPRQSHKMWLEFKRRDGWKWGKVKSEDKKRHPCMVAYNLLPAFDQRKDKVHIMALKLAKRIKESLE